MRSFLLGAKTEVKPALPYDAEVEYIQGNPDGAYIRIPTSIPASGSFSMRLFWSENRKYGPNLRAIFLSEQNKRGALFYQRWYAGGRLSCVIGSVALIELFDAGGKEHNLVDQAYSNYNESTLYLFGTVYDNNGATPWNPGSAGDDKLYSLSFKDSAGTLVIDLIPVRVGTVGYMYDRVSGQLFGNQGTGAFVIGPDKEVA